MRYNYIVGQPFWGIVIFLIVNKGIFYDWKLLNTQF